jgi:hypothetical protein
VKHIITAVFCALLALSVGAQITPERKEELKGQFAHPVSMDEAGIYHAPGDGYDIAAKPKITPDNQNYYMLGHIEVADEKGGWFVARIKHAGSMDPRMDRAMREMRQLTGRTKEPYFFVQLPKPLAKFFLANARVNGAVGVIGIYVVNSELPFTSGQKVTMPVISAVALDFGGVYSSIPLPKPKMKPIKEESNGASEGVIFINGRGQVLSSGTPNKNELQCVYDLVDKEKVFAEGWEDKILSICKNSAGSVNAAAPVQKPLGPEFDRYRVNFLCATDKLHPSEKLICAERRLGQLDGLLASTLRSRLEPVFQTDRKTMLESQSNWQIQRNNKCGNNSACIEASYRDRIRTLCEMPVPSGVKPRHHCDTFVD